MLIYYMLPNYQPRHLGSGVLLNDITGHIGTYYIRKSWGKGHVKCQFQEDGGRIELVLIMTN